MGGSGQLAVQRQPAPSIKHDPRRHARAGRAGGQQRVVGQGRADADDDGVHAPAQLVDESPRGPVLIDGQTRDIVQDVYIRKVERVPAMGNGLYNVEFDVIKAVKDPGKAK